MALHIKCNVCGRVAQVESEKKIGSSFVLQRLRCNHTRIQKIVQSMQDAYSEVTSESEKKLYQYQIDGVKFIESSGGRALIADEQGVGKTAQAIAYIKLHPQRFMVVCKSGLKMQFMMEILDWLGEEWMPQVLDSAASFVIETAPCYIVSFDLLRRIKDKDKKCPHCSHKFHKNGKRCKFKNCDCAGYAKGYDNDAILKSTDEEANGLEKLIAKTKVRLVILDEVQLIKNSASQRTDSVRELVKEIPEVIALSGTPIKNNALEYFPILNILHPEKFPTAQGFANRWCDQYFNGYKYQVGGIKNYVAFKDYTKDFIIRRTREEVLPDLPKVTRNFQYIELGDEVNELYSASQQKFEEAYEEYSWNKSFEDYQNVMAIMAEMRHWAGVAKIDPCIDWVTDFLMSCGRKITIFCHHIDVADAIENKLNGLLQDGGYNQKCLRITGGMDSNKRYEVQTAFNEDSERILVASQLASGEGLNLQHKCNEFIMLERQWNPANEEQCEGRFVRVGQLEDKVTGTYFTATGTIDEFFSELVERKRSIMRKSLDGVVYNWNETDIMKELMGILAIKGKRWSI